MHLNHTKEEGHTPNPKGIRFPCPVLMNNNKKTMMLRLLYTSKILPDSALSKFASVLEELEKQGIDFELTTHVNKSPIILLKGCDIIMFTSSRGENIFCFHVGENYNNNKYVSDININNLTDDIKKIKLEFLDEK